jgi:hypothetical protein
MLNQSRGGNLDDDVVDADLQIRIEGVDAFAHFSRAIHFDFGSQEEMWHRSQRRNEALGDCLSNLSSRLVAIG